MRRSFAFVSLLVACSSSTSSQPANNDAGPVDDGGVVVDADAVAPARPALSAMVSHSGCSRLRVTSTDLRFACASSGEAETDFSGVALPATPFGTMTVISTTSTGTRWTTALCVTDEFSFDALSSGETIVAGTFTKPCTIRATTLTTAGLEDGLVARLDATGKPTWAKRFGSTARDRALRVRFDRDGNAIVAGHVDTAPDASSLPVADGNADFVAKLSPTGDVIWSKAFHGSYGHTVATGADGSVVFVAQITDTENFGGETVPEIADVWRLVAVKYTADGSFVWQRLIDFTPAPLGTRHQVPAINDVVVGDDGGVWFAVGFGVMNVDFGAGTLKVANTELAKVIGHLDKNGAPIGGQIFEGRFAQLKGELAAGPGGTAFFASHTGGVDSGVLLASFTAMGTPAWRSRIGDRTNSRSLGFDGSAIVLLGDYERPLELAGKTFTTLGTQNLFLARFAP